MQSATSHYAKREMVRMTYAPKTAWVIPKIKGQWKQNADGTIDVWMTREQYEEIMSLVSALEPEREIAGVL